jgi:hypothetical protein
MTPDIHHCRSIRLKGYDYSQAGAYFVTVQVLRNIQKSLQDRGVIGSITPKSPNLSEANPDTLPFMGYVSNTMKTP